MNKNIIHKINALGGNTDAVNISENFAENWKNIRFNNHLYHKDWQLYGIDEFHPTVYSTDHEVYFQEIENRGKLEDFLDGFMTKEEFSETVITYLEEKSKE